MNHKKSKHQHRRGEAPQVETLYSACMCMCRLANKLVETGSRGHCNSNIDNVDITTDYLVGDPAYCSCQTSVAGGMPSIGLGRVKAHSLQQALKQTLPGIVDLFPLVAKDALVFTKWAGLHMARSCPTTCPTLALLLALGFLDCRMSG
jgi:hypothetical protein